MADKELIEAVGKEFNWDLTPLFYKPCVKTRYHYT